MPANFSAANNDKRNLRRNKRSQRYLINLCFRLRRSVRRNNIGTISSLFSKTNQQAEMSPLTMSSSTENMLSDSERAPVDSRPSSISNSAQATTIAAFAYVGSGICQPLIMQVCKLSGLANSTAQLYMLAYYTGPACLMFTLRRQLGDNDNHIEVLKGDSSSSVTTRTREFCPPIALAWKAAMIAIVDIAAQSLNYTGAGLAGATIFAVIYSSVTIWTAVFSYLLLQRDLSCLQWLAVLIVFGGLSITANHSLNLGPDVLHGTMLVLIGSCMHGGTYVLSEAIMIGDQQLTPRQNSAIQGLVACIGLTIWQVFYTVPRWDRLIVEPMRVAGTSLVEALVIMFSFAVVNLIHSFSFYHTLKNFPGGSTSAGVMKALQAVLVFVVAHFLYCGHAQGNDMCFSQTKFFSLVTVVGGVMLFGYAKENRKSSFEFDSSRFRRLGYTPIHREAADEVVI